MAQHVHDGFEVILNYELSSLDRTEEMRWFVEHSLPGAQKEAEINFMKNSPYVVKVLRWRSGHVYGFLIIFMIS